MPFRLRPYDPSDFETLYAIDRDCYPRGIAYSRRTLQWFLMQWGGDCLVAVTCEDPVQAGGSQAGSIVGFIIAEVEETQGSDAHIITLDVVAAHRREGIGTALVIAMEQRLAARGVRSIELETATSNETGVAFWQRHGYRSVGILQRYYSARLDAYSMTKHLAPDSEA